MARRKKNQKNQFIFIFIIFTCNIEKFDIPDIPWYSIQSHLFF